MPEHSAAEARLADRETEDSFIGSGMADRSSRDASLDAGPASASPLRDVRPQTGGGGLPRVVLEPGLPSGFINEHYDLWLRGQVSSATRIQWVSLRFQDKIVARLFYDRAAGSRTVTRPDGARAVQCGFAFCLQRDRSAAGASCAFTVETHTEDGASHSEPFMIAPSDNAGGRPAIVSGPVGQPGSALSPIMLYIERAAIGHDGQLLVEGWALALTPLLTIQAFSGEQRIGAAQLGRARDDVAQAHPNYPNAATSGFSIRTRLEDAAADTTHVRIEAITVQGCSHEVLHPVVRVETWEQLPTEVAEAAATPALEAEPDKRRVIHMHCDDVTLTQSGQLGVVGWALSGVGIARIEVQFDGETVGDAELALPRPDVMGAYSAIPMAAYSGFRFAGNLAREVTGEHTVTLIVRNGLDEVRVETKTARAVAAVEHRAAAPEPSVAEPVARMGFRLEIDMPAVIDHVVKQPVSGMLTLQGWALAHAAIAEIEILIDDERKGTAHHGLSRPDVAGAFPQRPDALRSGYVFLCPLRDLANGEHKVRVVATATDGETVFREFSINVQKDESKNSYREIRRSIPPRNADIYLALLGAHDDRPTFRFVILVERTAEVARLDETIRSLRGQVYQEWRVLLLARTPAVARAIRNFIDQTLHDVADRIVCTTIAKATGFDETPASPRQGATQAELFYGLLSPGDELGCDALAEVALFSRRHLEAELIYADESRICPVTGEREAYFKPGWSPDLLLSTNYIGRPWFVKAQVLARSGVTPRSLAAEGEYSAVLRCTEAAAVIQRHARLLCKRARNELDTPELERRALQRTLERRGWAATVMAGCSPGIWRVRREVLSPGLVSIIIPTCAARGYIKACIESLRSKTKYRNFEIICIDNIPETEPEWKSWLRANSDKVVEIAEAFNWSRFNNRAVMAASGEYLLFLNDDIEIVQEDWLDALMEHAQRPDVGIVGPQLLYPDRKVQHAGMFLSGMGMARHAFRMLAGDDPGYFGLALTQRNVIAVTGACMLVRRSSFDALGGFDEAHTIINNDLDYCLRAHAANQLTVYTPHATLIHHELASRDRLKDIFDSTSFTNRWKVMFSEGDPYFSPRLSLHSDDYRPDDEQVQEIFVGHPIGRGEEIKRILAAKLDHIGDFLTAIPAMRQLKAVFPHASLHVLASRTVKSFAENESVIDEFHEFEFFHARSGLGQKELTEDDYVSLNERLTRYNFDLAVDLRIHPDTRAVLNHVPARFRAGYDHVGEFPFLDITLEWNKDSPLQRKHTHVSDALLNLVSAIATAFEPLSEEPVLRAAPGQHVIERLPTEAQLLFNRRVVALHPGVGNTARQWPAEHFSALADLLVERAGVNVVLVGGPDERELADSVLCGVFNKDAVISLVGRTSLKDLPSLLKTCVLYVGNNSGPKHIAASLGVPTIGLHSGVVDAVEWGPLGNRAFALQRNMLCKPCYLLKADDCPRGLACMQQLEPAAVYQFCELLLNGDPLQVERPTVT